MNKTLNTNNLQSQLEIIRNLDAAECKKKNDDVIRMIDYYTGLTNAVEKRRNKFYFYSLIMTAIITAVIVIGMVNIETLVIFSLLNKSMIVIMTFIGLNALTQIAIMFYYYRQNKTKYIFNCEELKDYANKWKWFYYGNKSICKINTRKNTDEGKQYYISGLTEFMSRYLSEDSNTELENNMIQLYLLQVHNCYKNRQYFQLAKLQSNGFAISLICTVWAVIAVIFII